MKMQFLLAGIVATGLFALAPDAVAHGAFGGGGGGGGGHGGYLTDDPPHAIEAGKKYGIKMLSPEEARLALPHFGGLGANLT